MQTRLERHVEFTCQRLEELLLLSGGGSRLQRLLDATRSLRFVLSEGCHHNATKMMPALLVLAGECAHDLVERHAENSRALERDLLLSRLPASHRSYFEEARDNLLLRHDELAALTACRGLERACRDVATAHSVTLVVGASGRPLAECDLHDVMEALARCKWSDGSAVLDKASRASVQFARQMRNAAGHAGASSVEEWRETAVLAAAATCRLLERSGEPGQTITPTTMTKNW